MQVHQKLTLLSSIQIRALPVQGFLEAREVHVWGLVHVEMRREAPSHFTQSPDTVIDARFIARFDQHQQQVFLVLELFKHGLQGFADVHAVGLHNQDDGIGARHEPLMHFGYGEFPVEFAVL